MEPQQNPIQPQQSASDYYNKYKKRSFFLSRITVLSSMVVLIVALGINISLLYSHSTSTVASHAASSENSTTNLPSLPAGCDYQQVKGGFVVVCPTATPTPGPTVPINVALP